MEPDDCHEKIQVHGSADRVCVAAGRDGRHGGGSLSQAGISEATFYSWKKKYSGLGPVELRRLRQLEEENAQLKRIVADLTLDKQMLQDVLKKSSEGTATPAVGEPLTGGVSGLGATRLRDSLFATDRLSLPGPAARRSGRAATPERAR